MISSELLAEAVLGVSDALAAIVATGGSTLAAKAMTTAVPIVCAVGGEPVKLGLVTILRLDENRSEWHPHHVREYASSGACQRIPAASRARASERTLIALIGRL